MAGGFIEPLILSLIGLNGLLLITCAITMSRTADHEKAG